MITIVSASRRVRRLTDADLEKVIVSDFKTDGIDAGAFEPGKTTDIAPWIDYFAAINAIVSRALFQLSGPLERMFWL